jgi:hypothetical protein
VNRIPNVPLADVPQLIIAPKPSTLTRVLASASPKSSLRPSLSDPLTPSRLLPKSPSKKPNASHEFAVPFPTVVSPSKPVQTSTSSHQTPSRHGRTERGFLLTPRTPSTSFSSTPATSVPSTPVHQRGADATTAPETPSTSRRLALYERIRQRSLSVSPTKGKSASKDVIGGKLTKDQIARMGQDEMRRRCLLGRLGGVAESVWM